MSAKKIVVNADDFGLTESVSNSIVRIFHLGNLNSTTLMVNMPGTQHAVQLAKENPLLSVGLHFCITEGKSLSGVSSITDEQGGFLSRSTLIKKMLRRRVDTAHIKLEFEAQLAKFHSFGIRLSHIDSHQHIHMSPQVFLAIAPIIEREGVPMRIVRPVLNHRLAIKRPVKYLKQVVNASIAVTLRNRFNGKTNDCLVSIFDLENISGVTPQVYERLIGDTGVHGVVEVMVHPFSPGADVRDLYQDSISDHEPFLQPCKLEFDCMSSEKIIRNPNYTMVSYADV
jgi:chitin disaccharide deacetylase